MSAAVHPLRVKFLRIGSTAVVASVLLGSCIAMFVLGLGPLTGRYRVLTVLSGSMRPTLPVGSIVVVTPRPLYDVRVGDIITFQEPGDRSVLETHRVVRILRAGAVPVVETKGDDNARPDPWRLRLLAGPEWRVRLVIPAMGHALSWWRQPLIRTTAVLLIPPLLALLWIKEIWSPVGENRAIDSVRLARANMPWCLGVACCVVVATVAVQVIGARPASATFAGSSSVSQGAISSATLFPATAVAAEGGCQPSVSVPEITLTWTPTASTFASGYEIFRSDNSGGPYAPVSAVSGWTTTSYTDTSATDAAMTYYYVLQSITPDWSSLDSIQASGPTPATCP
jgi:signal peptidase I